MSLTLSFEKYDFEADEAYARWRANLDVVVVSDEAKIKRKYFDKFVNLASPASTPSTSSSSTSTPSTTTSFSSSSSSPSSSSSASAAPPRPTATSSASSSVPRNTSSSSTASTSSGLSLSFEQQLWFGSVLSVLVQSALCIVTFPLLPSVFRYTYTGTLLSAIIAYGVHLFHGVKPLRWTREYWTRMMQREELQYMVLAVLLMLVWPGMLFWLYLMPFFVNCLVALVGFVHTTFSPRTPVLSHPQVRQFLERVRANVQLAAIYVAFAELFILPALVLTVLNGGAGLLTPFAYYSILNLRYQTSAVLRTVSTRLADLVQAYVSQYSVLAKIWFPVRAFFASLVEPRRAR